jgi:hypothetical protein
MENRGKIHEILKLRFPNFCIVTVYTQFGYAMVDLEKYKDDL